MAGAPVNAFSTPQTSLSNLDAESAATLITAATDLTLIVDATGIIRDVALQNGELAAELDGSGSWLGRSWAELAVADSRGKVVKLLREASTGAAPHWRHVNIASNSGADIPLLFAAVRLGDDGRVVVFGRDLRPISALQQRLMNAQQSMERDYARIRNVETRYRLLLQTALDAVVILDGSSQAIVEANQQAERLLGRGSQRRVSDEMLGLFMPECRAAVQSLLATVRATGRPGEAAARLIDEARDVRVFATLFREDASFFLLARIVPQPHVAAGDLAAQREAQLAGLVDHSPDGIVVSDTDGRILAANAAFLDLAQIPSEEQARGEVLDRWIGRPGVDLDILVSHLVQHGIVRLFSTTLRGQFGVPADVEISAAAAATPGREQRFGFVIRDVGRRIAAPSVAGPTMRSAQQVTDLIGRVPLRELVRDSTDLIEQLCIEAALAMTGDNRAAAAEMLGLSRQSLYVKMRRYGLGDLADGDGV